MPFCGIGSVLAMEVRRFSIEHARFGEVEDEMMVTEFGGGVYSPGWWWSSL